MDQDKALGILQSLSNGADPFTGQPFPADSPYQHPDVVRALFQAVRAMEGAVAAQKRQAARPAGGNSGKPWAKDEDERLLAAFDQGRSIDDLAAALARPDAISAGPTAPARGLVLRAVEYPPTAPAATGEAAGAGVDSLDHG